MASRPTEPPDAPAWVPWKAQPGPQFEAIQARECPELLFGGARGGGKSDFLLGDWCQDADQGAAWRGIIFRRTYPELEELITRSQTLIPQTFPGSEWAKSEKTWRLMNGATLKMRSLERSEDVASYWGHQYSWLAFDELGAFPDDRPYRMLMACLRSAEPVQAKRIRATANPGGVGHAWIKARFIDPAPHGYVPIIDGETGAMRMFIPSRVQDNVVLMARDPGYVDRLKGVGSPELVRAWLDGDWNAVVGSFFPEFGHQHIITPMRLPPHWLRFKALDWGSARPFCCLWFAVADGAYGIWPQHALIVYREWYGAASPNVGLRLTAEDVARGIRERELGDEPTTYGVADPAIFASDGGPSIAERMANTGVRFRPADNKRVGKLGVAQGWDHVRHRLVGDDGAPMLYVFSTCSALIRTLPTMQHDPRRPEDMDSTGDDHAADALRYGVTSRPWLPAPRELDPVVSMNFLWEQQEKERARW
jgi:hypothetical protein